MAEKQFYRENGLILNRYQFEGERFNRAIVLQPILHFSETLSLVFVNDVVGFFLVRVSFGSIFGNYTVTV